MPFLLDSSWSTPSKCPITSLFMCQALAACWSKKFPLDKKKLQNFVQIMTSQPPPIVSPFTVKTFSTEPQCKNSQNSNRVRIHWGFQDFPEESEKNLSTSTCIELRAISYSVEIKQPHIHIKQIMVVGFNSIFKLKPNRNTVRQQLKQISESKQAQMLDFSFHLKKHLQK